jgi:histidinol dehydrogenase
MKLINYSDRKGIEEVLDRKSLDLEKAVSSVKPILDDVRLNGDPALIEYTKKFDNFRLTEENLKVSAAEIEKAYSKVDDNLVSALKHAHRNISRFHGEQLGRIDKGWNVEVEDGVFVGERASAVESVGAYVPGGRASYPSTVLMTCIPAKVAGVERIVIASPPPISDSILVAADICNVDEIYRVGGAQAIAALAYGTESIPRVDKIVGPGNVYVLAAKMLVYGRVDVDMPAGPSEVLILGDETTNPRFVAADLLAQAEHDPDAQCVLATDSRKLAEEVDRELAEQLKSIKTKETAEKSLGNAVVVLTEDIGESIEFANRYAAEHLEVMTDNPQKVVEKIRNAGAIFLGEYSPVAAGDYASGGNHVLPTGGAARFSSELGVRDFLKSSSIQNITRKGLSNLEETIVKIAGSEGFDAHLKSVRIRFK